MISTVAAFLIAVLAVSSVSAQPSLPNDLAVLNYALTLEHLEATFYTLYQSQFNASAFVAAGYNASVYANLDQIRMHEVAHVNLLNTTIAGLGGVPVPQCVYQFPVTNVSTYIAVADLLENTGVSAYDGGFNGLTLPALQTAAATIATVEARHASYLDLLLGKPAVGANPNGTDVALTPAQVIAAASAFFVSCPYNLTANLPTVRPNGVGIGPTVGTSVITGPIVAVANATGTPSYTAQQLNDDLLFLNYALDLEYLGATLYNRYVGNVFNLSSFLAANLTAYDYQQFLLFQAHENSHVAIVSTQIRLRGGVPISPCNYTFPIATVRDLVAVATGIENTCVGALDFAGNTISDTNLQQAAATIATIEGRHASYLNYLSGVIPFPSITDPTFNYSMVIANLSKFLTNQSCPQVAAQALPFVQNETTAALAVAATIRGDPSFVGFHGEAFQVHGIADRVFNLITAPTLQVNARFSLFEQGDCMSAHQMQSIRSVALKSGKSIPSTAAWTHNGTYLSEMGIKLGQNRVKIVAGEYATGMVATVNDALMTLTKMTINDYTISMTTPHQITITHPLVKLTMTNSDRFFNMDYAELTASDSQTMTMDGLLGQTAHSDFKLQSTAQFKFHQVYDYLIRGEDLFEDDFVLNRFVNAKASN